ncbi:A disintegrin and metalloproteinase with thrombospondin motifs 8 [Varanus komodoensis]|nr:A disintegrin and metalloproteinase with thrombospondin motifs 8 [Varanus komodoensis]
MPLSPPQQPPSSRLPPALTLLPLLLLLLLLPNAWALSMQDRGYQEVVPVWMAAPSASGGQVSFTIAAFGREFLLQLEPDASFLAPGLKIQHVGSKVPAGFLSEEEEEKDVRLRRCFYSGTVNLQPDSLVAVSLCQGIHGSFLVDGDEYVIQPQGHQSGDPLLQVHQLQKRGWSREDSGDIPERDAPAEPNSTPGRTKRFTSQARYVETLLVADTSMVRFYGGDLTNHILTLMSVAAQIYKHPSLKNSINLVVVKVLVVEDEKAGPEVSDNGGLMLRNFCNWQQRFNPPSDRHSEHYDTAILLTRQDFCGHQSCSTLGVAETGTMCDRNKSCSVIEDEGLQAAYTLAHELGHVLSMPHDDSKTCERLFGALGKHHMMAPLFIHLNKTLPWSPCSAMYITEFLDGGHGDCLLDEPADSIPLPTDLPGQMPLYSLDHQCQQIFGKEFRHCPNATEKDVCSQLWCKLEAGERLCHTKNGSLPWADGTPCGMGKICLDGQCMAQEQVMAKIPQQTSFFSKSHGFPGSFFHFWWSDCINVCSCKYTFKNERNPAKTSSVNEQLMKCKMAGSSQNADEWLLQNPHIPRHIAKEKEERGQIGQEALNSRYSTGLSTGQGWLPFWYYILPGRTVDAASLQESTGIKAITEGFTAVDGSWGPWSSWGPCSRTCDGGVRFSFRACDNPLPKNGGKYCEGQRVQYESCHTEECPPNDRSFREQQCEKYDRYNFTDLNGNLLEWVPMYAGVSPRDRCKLICRAKRGNEFKVFETKVIDGTLCAPDTLSVCVHGQCFKAGCDHIIGSPKKFDKCGVCGGNGSTCRKITGSFNKSKFGYNDIITIPAGATNIDVKHSRRGVRHDGNYLALRTLDGKYLLNGNFTISATEQDIFVKGSVLRYSGSLTTLERLQGYQQLPEPLIVQVLNVSKEADMYLKVRYTFFIPKDIHFSKQKSKEKSLANVIRPMLTSRWVLGDWSKCSKSCGSGWQRRTVECLDTEGQLSPTCDRAVRPEDIKPCNYLPCPIWQMGPWSPCSQTCGEGTRTRSAVCVDYAGKSVASEKCGPAQPVSAASACVLQEC